MLAALLRVARLSLTVAMFEIVGAALIVAGVWTLAGYGWAFIAGGVLCLAKAFDLALERS